MGLKGTKHRVARMAATVGVILTAASVAQESPMAPHVFTMANAATMADATSIRLPVYPGAGPQPYATVEYGPQTSPNLKTGSARYVVRANVDQVTAWYIANMSAHGYRLQSKTPNGGRDGLGQLLDFVAKGNPGLDVTVDFSSVAIDPEDIAIGYTVTDATTPPRSADTMVPQGLKRVVIQYEPASTSGPSPMIKRTLSNPGVVTALVHAINALPVDIRSSVDDTTQYQGGATLRFMNAGGHAVVVKVEMAENRVVVRSTSPLFDSQNHVWQMVSKDMGFAAYPPRK